MDINNILRQFQIRKLTGFLSSKSDRRTVYTGLVIICLFITIASYNMLAGNSGKYQKQLSVLENNLMQVRVLQNEYKQSKQRLDELIGTIKKENESLISVVEKIFIDNGIERTGFSIKDSKLDESYSYELSDEAVVQVDLKKVPLKRLIDVLYSIQNRDSFLKVSNLRLKIRFNRSELVDASFKLSTFEIARM